MRIAMVDFTGNPARPGTSGLSDIVWSMARELAQLGDDVHIVAPYTVDPPSQPGISVHRFPIPPIGYRNFIGHSLIILRAWQEVRKIGSLDLIHAPEYHSTGMIAPFSSTPVVLTTPGNIYERIANGNPYDWYTTCVYKVMAQLSARHCTMINAISEDMAHWWERTGAPRARIAVIPHGIDTQCFGPVPNARKIIGLSPDASIVLYVGRLSPEKNVDVLIRAVGQSAPHIPGLRVHIIGDGPQRQALEHLAHELSVDATVQFHGSIPHDQMQFWYTAADVCVLPSSSEGLPRVMLESWACGTAFIGTAISGIRDHLRDGSNGYLLQYPDASDLARLLQTAFADREHLRGIGHSGLEYVRNHLNWKTVVQRFRQAVAEALQRMRAMSATATL